MVPLACVAWMQQRSRLHGVARASWLQRLFDGNARRTPVATCRFSDIHQPVFRVNLSLSTTQSFLRDGGFCDLRRAPRRAEFGTE
jgi:hypothetical protein